MAPDKLHDVCCTGSASRFLRISKRQTPRLYTSLHVLYPNLMYTNTLYLCNNSGSIYVTNFNICIVNAIL